MDSPDFDVIVIGGGPAGSTTATTLAQAGHSVLLLEKAKFPREHVGESLLPFCYPIFQDLGVLDQMETNYSRKPGATFSNIDGSSYSRWCFSHVIKDESYLSFHVRRASFDNMLLRNSEKHGVKVMEEMAVRRVNFERNPNQVTVIAGNSKGGDLTFVAKFVVDASGQSTILANQLNSKRAFENLTPRVAYSTHWTGVNWDDDLRKGNIKIILLEGEKLGWLWMIPVGEDRLSVGVALKMDYANAERRRLSSESDDWVKSLYLQELASSPLAAKITKGAEIAQPIAANGDFSYYAADKYGDRFAIVGDAAGFMDPIFSSGIYLGMKGGQRVATGISQWLKEGKQTTLQAAYHDIEGAYRLIEKLISTFYQPGSIKFSGADQVFEQDYEKFESAYSILHLILAGDFFTNHEKYIKAVGLLQDQSMIEKYKSLIRHPKAKQEASCVRLEENTMA